MLPSIVLALVEQGIDRTAEVTGGFSFSVSIGDLISVATSIVAVVTAYTRIAERIAVIEVKVGHLWDTAERRIEDRRRS